MGFILIGFEIVFLFLLAISGDSISNFLAVIVTDTVAFFRISAFTIIGIHYCAQLGIPSFPFFLKNLEQVKIEIADSSSGEEKEPSPEPFPIEKDISPFSETIEPVPHSTIVFPSIEVRDMVLSSSMVALGGILFSILLFWLTKPTMSALAQANFGQELTMTNILATLVFVLSFAFAEEIAFRLGIQNFLAQHFSWQGEKYWLAIILTSFIWTIGHVGLLEPNWVKMVQIFPVGLALGWLFRKYGVESTIIVHSIFNVVLIWPSELLIS